MLQPTFQAGPSALHGPRKETNPDLDVLRQLSAAHSHASGPLSDLHICNTVVLVGSVTAHHGLGNPITAPNGLAF